jgi:hypothetical protein
LVALGAIEVRERVPGGGWSAPRRVATTNAAVPADVNMAVAADGAAVIVWDEGLSVHAVVRPAGGEFQAPIVLAASSTDVTVGVASALADPADGLRVGWYQTTGSGTPAPSSSQVEAVLGADGAPGPAQPVSFPVPPSPLMASVLVRSASGARFFMRSLGQGGQRIIQTSRQPSAAGGWEPLQTIFRSPLVHSTPDLAVDARGDAIAVWQVVTGRTEVVRAAVRPAGAGAFQAAEKVDGAGPNPLLRGRLVGGGTLPSVGIASNGTAVAAWRACWQSFAPTQVRCVIQAAARRPVR